MHNLNKDKSLEKTVLITGITSGIGSKTAIKFAEKGWQIIGNYSSAEEKAKKLKEAIETLSVNCHIYKVDFSSRKELLKFSSELGKYDISTFVNNAGTYVVSKHFSQLTIDEIEKTFMVNVFAPMLLSAKVFMQMKEKKYGRIVNISSIAAKYGGSSYSMHYGCSKRALEGMTKTFAKEGAEYNVLVNTIRPGVIDTDFHKKFPKDMKKRIEMIPIKKMGNTKDIADMVYYLGSDENNFITNEIITIAGGE